MAYVLTENDVRVIKWLVNLARKNGLPGIMPRRHSPPSIPCKTKPVIIKSNTGGAGPFTSAQFLSGDDGDYTVKIDAGDGSKEQWKEIPGCRWAYGRDAYWSERTLYLALAEIWGTLPAAASDGWAKDADNFMTATDTWLDDFASWIGTPTIPADPPLQPNPIEATGFIKWLEDVDAFIGDGAVGEDPATGLIKWTEDVVDWQAEQGDWNSWAAGLISDLISFADEHRTFTEGLRNRVNSIINCAKDAGGDGDAFCACVAYLSTLSACGSAPTGTSQPDITALEALTGFDDFPEYTPSWDGTPPSLGNYGDEYYPATATDRAFMIVSPDNTNLLYISKDGMS